jgi:hypothetical protein
MFDRFIRLARAKKALREQRFEVALRLAADPLIEADRRAEQVRAEAGSALAARIRALLTQGDLPLARAELAPLRGLLEPSTVRALSSELEAATTGEEAVRELQQRTLAAVRQALQAGQLGAAQRQLTAWTGPCTPELKQLQALHDEQQRQAAAIVGQALVHIEAGEVALAGEQLSRAALLDAEAAGLVAARAACVRRGAPLVASAVQERLAAEDLVGALRRWRAELAAIPGLQTTDVLRAVHGQLVSAVVAALQHASDLAVAAGIAAAVVASNVELPGPARALADAVLAALPWQSPGAAARGCQRAEAGAMLVAAARAIGADGLAKVGSEWVREAAAHDAVVASAQALVGRGELDAARTALREFLLQHPLHEAARRELDLIEHSLADLTQRLATIREAVRSGHLLRASAASMAFAGPSALAAEAAQLGAEARARMALVDRGLDEVRVALHGRAAATAEGVRHCALRLEELAKVQLDHPELPRVLAAVQVEIQALALAEQALHAAERGAMREALQHLTAWFAQRPHLLVPDRLDAKLLDLGDRIARLGDVALAAGRLLEVQVCYDGLQPVAALRPEFATRIAAWPEAIGGRQATARELLQGAQARLAARDLAEAERLAEQAAAQWADGNEVRDCLAQLRQVRHQVGTLDRARSLTAAGDYAGAHETLAALAVTPPLLRTRIYDMKQDLARAQGLEGAFLLRVDEGGEHLVLRGESVSFGNVRQARADVPILANLAGRHASVRRSMSFHGGMQDCIVAEEGEVRIGGVPVTEKVLQPGDRIQLGSALGLQYQRACGRSHTVSIGLLGGFQVAGTDRLLLMKDRGRDGRILLGPGEDVHVRVARATGEVEVFATAAGQMRVACVTGGTIDGAPFRGEHPVAASQLVVAAGISFLLLPWTPGR